MQGRKDSVDQVPAHTDDAGVLYSLLIGLGHGDNDRRHVLADDNTQTNIYHSLKYYL